MGTRIGQGTRIGKRVVAQDVLAEVVTRLTVARGR